jgi:hypothetical protein
VWHELVLHGIGGCTIAEAKERLSYAEALDWFAYIRKRGSLHDGMRVEAAAALISVVLNRVNGGKADMADFMPHAKPQAADSIDGVMNLLLGAKRA